ncbi:MAG: MBL fold metallo-hydrolase [Alphaproteobacteria bacterium]|nr:MBL fold metallo-hydrolase [Alphaproteobacteria bacterium]
MSVHTIDCEYMVPEVAAAYLVVDRGEAAFVETNTTHAVPRLLAALEAQGLSPADVRWIVVTHIHLDHAGGAGALLQHCPNATLLAHPRAAPHAIDPARIVAGATAVYGEARFRELYGAIVPAPADRVRALEDGATVELGGQTLRFLHTRGHANHHFCVLAEAEDGVFTGDSFGIVYPALQRNGLFAFASTSPTDFDGPAALASIDRILATGVRRAWPTHFGEQTDLAGIAAQMRDGLEQSMRLVEGAEGLDDAELDAFFAAGVGAMFEARLERAGLASDPMARALLALDIDLNAQGLAFAVRKARFKRS